MIRHVVKVDSDGLLLEELDALDADLSVLCRLMRRFIVVIPLLLLLTLVLGLDCRAINAASLVRFVDLGRDYFFQINLCLLMCLQKGDKLLNVVLNRNFDGLEEF